MNSTKKRIAIILMAVLVLAVLCSCGKKETAAPAPVESPEMAEAEPTPTPEPTPSPFQDYEFTVYGKTFNTADETIDLRKVKIDDEAAELLKYLPDCHNLKTLDMDNCGVTNEKMAEIRDAYPDTEVIWRVFFRGVEYSIRTNAETFVCSLTNDDGSNGFTDAKSTEALKYCTKIKYMDLGHENRMESIDFVKYMPDLEVFICYHTSVSDLSPLENCQKLWYLELGWNSELKDISPLAKCTGLTDLQIGKSYGITDISPLYDLPLARLWLGDNHEVPEEQIREYMERHPGCVNLADYWAFPGNVGYDLDTVPPMICTWDPEVDLSWRIFTNCTPFDENTLWPQYSQIRAIFQYGPDGAGQSWSEFDPYYTS